MKVISNNIYLKNSVVENPFFQSGKVCFLRRGDVMLKILRIKWMIRDSNVDNN